MEAKKIDATATITGGCRGDSEQQKEGEKRIGNLRSVGQGREVFPFSKCPSSGSTKKTETGNPGAATKTGHEVTKRGKEKFGGLGVKTGNGRPAKTIKEGTCNRKRQSEKNKKVGEPKEGGEGSFFFPAEKRGKVSTKT